MVRMKSNNVVIIGHIKYSINVYSNIKKRKPEENWQEMNEKKQANCNDGGVVLSLIDLRIIRSGALTTPPYHL
jgi:hypothetical protein